MSRLALAAVFLACSCAHGPATTHDEVSDLVRQCGLEGKVKFKWVDSDKVTITRFDADAGRDRFMCVSHGLEARGLKLGFEGREQLNL